MISKRLWAILTAVVLLTTGLVSAQGRFSFGETQQQPQVGIFPTPPGYQSIRVTVTPDRRTVQAGDQVGLTVRTDADAYLYVYAIDPQGITRQLLPNFYDRDHFVRANQTKRLPSQRYELRASGGGWNTIHVVAVSTQHGGWNPPLELYPRAQSDPFPIVPGGVKGARESLQRSLPDPSTQSSNAPPQQGIIRQPGSTTNPRAIQSPAVEGGTKPMEFQRPAEGATKPLEIRKPLTEENGPKPLQLQQQQQQGIIVGGPGGRQPTVHDPNVRWGEAYTQIYVQPAGQPWVPAPGQPLYPYQPAPPGIPFQPDPWRPIPPGHVVPENQDSGTLRLTASERAEVYIDDVFYGRTPLTVELPVGRYEVVVHADGYKPWQQEVKIRRNRTQRISVNLQRQPRASVRGGFVP